jgi:hypothetical protein
MTPYEEAKTARQGTTKRLFTGDDWRTPIEILRLVFEAFGGDVDLDPCPNPDPEYQFATFNPLDKNGDPCGLDAKWPGSRCFYNPPYSQTKGWVAKATDEPCVNSIGLIPPSVGTAYWHEHIFAHDHVERPADAVCFYKGRIDFLAPKGMQSVGRGIWEYEADSPWVPYKINRYDSAFVLRGIEYLDPFCRVFETVGRVVRP